MSGAVARRYGKYRGVVTDVDPATMRLKATVPALFGTTPTGWATACVPFAGPNAGFVMLPEVGAGVWIEFEGGDASLPIWSGGYWLAGETPSVAAAGVRAIVSEAGQRIVLDAGGGMTISDAFGNTIALGSGGVTIKTAASMIELGPAGFIVNNGAFEVT